MPIPLFNSIASWILKKRIHQMELFTKYPNEVQNELLFNLLRNAQKTEIGKKYSFREINCYNEFKKNIPISTYEDVEADIERCRKGEQNIFWPTQIKWFAKSSGTTNSRSKFIPVSNEALEDCHYKAGKDMLCIYFNKNENSQLLTGKSLRLGGSNELIQCARRALVMFNFLIFTQNNMEEGDYKSVQEIYAPTSICFGCN